MRGPLLCPPMDLAPLALLLLFLVASALWWRERNRAQHLLQQRNALQHELEHCVTLHEDMTRRAVIAEQRERAHADLHDQIGARLLALSDAAPGTPAAEIADAILSDLRQAAPHRRGRAADAAPTPVDPDRA